MQGIKDSARKGGGDGKPASPPAEPSGGGETPPERGSRKKGS
jgi:hypothetical protein